MVTSHVPTFHDEGVAEELTQSVASITLEGKSKKKTKKKGSSHRTDKKKRVMRTRPSDRTRPKTKGKRRTKTALMQMNRGFKNPGKVGKPARRGSKQMVMSGSATMTWGGKRREDLVKDDKGRIKHMSRVEHGLAMMEKNKNQMSEPFTKGHVPWNKGRKGGGKMTDAEREARRGAGSGHASSHAEEAEEAEEEELETVLEEEGVGQRTMGISTIRSMRAAMDRGDISEATRILNEFNAGN